jgi:hypothetical protein
MINFSLNIISLFFTGWGIYLLITGDITNGLLALILGELIDMPKLRIDIGRIEKEPPVSKE